MKREADILLESGIMSKKLHFLSSGELLIIIAVMLIALAAAFFMRRNTASVAVIECGQIHEEVDLSSDGIYEFDGINAVFEVADGKIRIMEAACPDKICEKTGYIGSAGQSIICVPEKIIVTVSGEETSSPDVTVG